MDHRKKVVERLLDGVGRYDAASLAALFCDDAEWWAPVSSSRLGVSRPLVGREAVVDLLAGGTRVMRPGTTTWTVYTMVVEGDTVIAHVQRRCLTANGAPYENDYMLRFDFDDNLIARAWETADTALAFELFDSGSPG